MRKTPIKIKRKAVSFRFQPKTLKILEKLEQQTNRNRTELLEEAVSTLNSKLQKKGSEHPLAKFAGILSEEEANQMLETLNESRKEQLKLQKRRMKELESLL
jgi:hypothetical protein